MDVSDATTIAYDDAAGVIAHGLLNTMTVIGGAAELLRTEWDALSDVRRGEMLSLIELHVAEASQALVGIVQGLSPDALDLLDQLSRLRDEAVVADPPRLRRRRGD